MTSPFYRLRSKALCPGRSHRMSWAKFARSLFITVAHDLNRPFRIGRLPFLQPHSAVVFNNCRGSRSPLPGGGRHARCRLLTRLHAQAEESGGAHVEESRVDPIHPSGQQNLILNELFFI